MTELYGYVGPAGVKPPVGGHPAGTRAPSAADLLACLRGTGRRPGPDGSAPATFVTDGRATCPWPTAAPNTSPVPAASYSRRREPVRGKHRLPHIPTRHRKTRRVGHLPLSLSLFILFSATHCSKDTNDYLCACVCHGTLGVGEK
jgi:hypothetical protein